MYGFRCLPFSLLLYSFGVEKSHDTPYRPSNVPPPNHDTHTMGPSTSNIPCADADTWAIDHAVSLPEFWALVAARSGLVGAWRLAGVCRVARTGVREFLRTLPRLVVCGGSPAGGGVLREVWGLSLATLRWEAMPALLCARYGHACCTVRGALVVLGGRALGDGNVPELSRTSRVEMLSKGAGAFVELPPLSCGAISDASAVVVNEDDSVQGQVLLIGGDGHDGTLSSSVQLVDLATGVCTQQADLLHARRNFAAARLPDRRIVCTGGSGLGLNATVAEMLGPPVQGAMDAAWIRWELPAMSVARRGCRGCVLSDGRLAVLGGMDNSALLKSSCEALSFGADGHWTPLPPMHDARVHFACAAVAECIIVAGGLRRTSAEVYDEALGRWLRLPCNSPHSRGLYFMGSVLMQTTR
jgi:hypothetical protein